MFSQKPVFKQIHQNQVDSHEQIPSFDEQEDDLMNVSEGIHPIPNFNLEDSMVSIDSQMGYIAQFSLPSNLNDSDNLSDNLSEVHHQLAYIRALTIQMDRLFDSYNYLQDQWNLIQPLQRQYQLVNITYHKQCEDLTCRICLMDFIDNENIVSLNCKHVYHPNCIKTWLELSDFCPLCKQKLIPIAQVEQQ